MARNKLKDEDRRPVAVEQDMQEDEARESPVMPSTDELEARLAEEAMQNALPNLPAKPGWHRFWASTTNTYTPVQYFLRLGYVPIKGEELPEMMHLKALSGEFAGFVTVNEMVGLQVPEDIYQKYMKIMHHDRPMSEAERLKANVDAMKQDLGEDSKGRPLLVEEGEGYASLTKTVKTPKRFE